MQNSPTGTTMSSAVSSHGSPFLLSLVAIFTEVGTVMHFPRSIKLLQTKPVLNATYLWVIWSPLNFQRCFQLPAFVDLRGGGSGYGDCMMSTYTSKFATLPFHS